MIAREPAERGAPPGEARARQEAPVDLSLSRFRAPRYWPGWLILGALKLAALLPFPVQLALGRVLGAASWILFRRRRRIAAVNLELCFPELSADARKRLARRHFDALGMSIVELAMAWFTPLERLRRLVRLDGLEHLEQALSEGRGVILLTAHFTPLDVCFAALCGLLPPFGAMYRSQRNEMLDVLVCRGRRRYADEQIPRDDVRALLRALKRGKMVVYLPDQTHVGNQSALLPFLGEPAMTNIAMSKLARFGNARVVPCLMRRLPGFAGYEMKIGPPLDGVPSDDPIRDTETWLEVFEAAVRTAPEQYLWIYKKFKSRPAPLPDPYRNV